MYLATRRIRSAGRTSGSIEITLPTELQVLEGVECRLLMRDGSRPEIVLQPNLSEAQALFREFWQKLRLGLRRAGEIGDFSVGDFTLVLFPPRHWQERPPLAYADALAVLHRQSDHHDRYREALAQLLASLAVVAGGRLGLEGALALAFSDSIAYLMVGRSPGLGTDFERGMAHRIYWGNRTPESLGSPLHEQVWRQAQPGLQQVSAEFYAWQENPNAYAADREKWYRALTLEMET
jgi:hypothetical protein